MELALNIVELGDEKMWGDKAQPRGVGGDSLSSTSSAVTTRAGRDHG